VFYAVVAAVVVGGLALGLALTYALGYRVSKGIYTSSLTLEPVNLNEAGRLDWSHIQRLGEECASLGFLYVGDYYIPQIRPGEAYVRAFCEPSLGCYSVINNLVHPSGVVRTYPELTTVFEGGASLTTTNMKDACYHARPPETPMQFVPGADLRALLGTHQESVEALKSEGRSVKGASSETFAEVYVEEFEVLKQFKARHGYLTLEDFFRVVFHLPRNAVKP